MEKKAKKKKTNKKSKNSKAKEKEKNKGGRPQKLTFDQALLSCISELAKQGKTNKEIAEILHISEDTFYRYKKLNKEFSESLKDSEIADELVEQALFSRATGFWGKETKFATYEGIITDHKEVDKWYPPDPTSMIFWLKNRRPDRWRDKKESEVTVNNLHEALASALDGDDE